MKNIWKIFKTDLNNIRGNKSAIIVLVALMILPSMYAWFNILPSWDPYENTGDVEVAIVNLDEGTEIEDEEINIGEEVVLSLLDNEQMGWQFVDEKEAMDGVEQGDYYASIVIPEDFSKNLTSVLEEEQTKPVLDYYINEKINAIAPKVTASGASGVIESIESGFIKITNEAIFTAFNNIGIELEGNLPAIERFRDSIYHLEDELPEFERYLELANTNIVEIEKAVGKAHDGMDKAEDITEEVEVVSERLEEILRQGDEAIQTHVPTLKQNLTIAQKVVQEVPEITNNVAQKGNDVDQFLNKVVGSTDKIDEGTDSLENLIEILEDADKRLTEDRNIDKFAGKLKEEEEKIARLKTMIHSAIDLLEQGDHAGTTIVSDIDELAKEMEKRLETLIEVYEQNFVQEIQTYIEKIETESPQIKEKLYDINEWNKQKLEEVTDIIENDGSLVVGEQKEKIESISGAVGKRLDEVEAIVGFLTVIYNLTELEQLEKPLEKVKDIQSQLQDLDVLLDNALEKLEKGEEVSEAFWPSVKDILEKVTLPSDEEFKQFEDSLDRSFADSVAELKRMDEEIDERLSALNDTLEKVSGSTSDLVDMVENPELTLSVLQDMAEKMTKGQEGINAIIDISERLQKAFDDGIFLEGIDRTENLQADLLAFKDVVLRSVADAKDSKKNVDETLNDINAMAVKIDGSITDIVDFIDQELMPKYKDASDKAHDALNKGNKMLGKAKTYFPEINKLLNTADDSIDKGKSGLDTANEAFPEVEEKIVEIAERVKTLDEKGDLADIINLMKNNPDAESDFFSDPIVLQEHELFPIPNYGSAMSPFFTSLALWVGGLILVSSLIVDVPNKHLYKSYEAYFGRFLLFWVIGIAQAFVVTMGNLFLLKTFVAHKFMFVLFGFAISTVFIVIVYTLVSVFGNTGKVIAIVLLVMQLGASGGTFPIQMTPMFFQKLHNFLPFTHALGLLREAVGGIIWKAVFIHIAWLIGYTVLFLFIGIKLKRHINKSSDKFLEEARESEVIL